MAYVNQFVSCLGDKTRVTYISSNSDASHVHCEAWVECFSDKQGELRGYDTFLGLDVEWTANTVKGQQRNPAATLQLAYYRGNETCDCCGRVMDHYESLVLQLPYFNARESGALMHLLENPYVMKVGVGIDDDVNKLRLDHGLDSKNCLDLGDLAEQGFGWKPRPGLKALCKNLLGGDLYKPKDIYRWNFDKKPLTDHKIKYAATRRGGEFTTRSETSTTTVR